METVGTLELQTGKSTKPLKLETTCLLCLPHCFIPKCPPREGSHTRGPGCLQAHLSTGFLRAPPQEEPATRHNPAIPTSSGGLELGCRHHSQGVRARPPPLRFNDKNPSTAPPAAHTPYTRVPPDIHVVTGTWGGSSH